MTPLPLRYRLEIAGIALDVRADPAIDLARFDDRARRYGRAGGAPEHVLELATMSEQVYRPVDEQAAARLVVDERGNARIEAFQCVLHLESPNVTRGRVADATGFENALRLMASRLLLERGGAVLHAAALRHGDEGVVFPGESGAGKSTLTLRQSEEHQVSEDLTAVRPVAGGWLLEALPFLAAHNLDVGPRAAKLVAFAFPRKAAAMGLRPLAERDVRGRLARSLVVFASAAGFEETLIQRAIELSRAVPGFELELDKSTPFWPDLLRQVTPARAPSPSTAEP